jgi:hypothetical protein
MEVVMVILRILATYAASPESAYKSHVEHNHMFSDSIRARDFANAWLADEATWSPPRAPRKGQHLINSSFVAYSTHENENGEFMRDGIIFREYKDFACRF